MNHLYESFRLKETQAPLNVGVFENMAYISHLHRAFEFVYLFEGEMTIIIDGEKKEMKKDEFCIITGNQVHGYATQDYSRGAMVIAEQSFIPDYCAKFKNKSLSENIIHIDESKINFAHEILEKMISKAQEEKGGTGEEFLLKGMLYVLLGELYSDMNFLEKKSVEPSTLQNILAYVDNNYESDISLETVSKNVGVSKYHISKLFNQKVGCSFNDYLKLLRVNKAKQLLKLDSTIAQVAYDCGFNTIRSFYRAFNEVTDNSPSKYREDIAK